MDNLEQEDKNIEDKIAKEESSSTNVSAEGADIEFDENINIEELQKKLDTHMETFDFSEESSVTSDNDPEKPEQNTLPPLKNIPLEIDPKSKKYVIYIDPENVEFMETLSINDRKIIINKILQDQNEAIAKQKYIEHRRKFLRQILVATITFIIGFPLLFTIVNLSLESTIKNYTQSKKDFSTLYRENGKIQQKKVEAQDSLKY